MSEMEGLFMVRRFSPRLLFVIDVGWWLCLLVLLMILRKPPGQNANATELLLFLLSTDQTSQSVSEF